MISTLLSALETMVKVANEAHDHWDADRDMKVGKYLLAMAGRLKGYRADLTAVHEAIAKGREAMERARLAREAGPDPDLMAKAIKRLESRDLGIELARRVIARCEEGTASRHQFADGKGSLAGCSLSLDDIEIAKQILDIAKGG